MQNYNRLYSTLIVLCVSLCGCALGSLTTYSKLVGSNQATSKTYIKNNLVCLPSLSLTIRPYNSYDNVACFGIIIPIFPFGFQIKSEYNDRPFYLSFEFEAKETGFTVNPNNFFLCYQNNKYSPTKMSACYGGKHYSGSYRPAGVPSGRDWGCAYKTQRIDDNEMSDSIESFQLQGKTCFILKFPISTLHPKKKFSIQIDGLSKDGTNLFVPELIFEERKTYEYELLGN